MSRFVCCSSAARPSSAVLTAKANATPHCHRERERCIVVRCVKYATYSRNHGCNALFQPGNLINVYNSARKARADTRTSMRVGRERDRSSIDDKIFGQT